MASNRDKEVVGKPTQQDELVRKAMWGLINGVAAQRTFAEMLIHSEGMNENDAPSLEEVAHMVAGMAERLDLMLNHVKTFVFSQVGRVES